MAGTRRIRPPTPGRTPGFCNPGDEEEAEEWNKLEGENRHLWRENAKIESELRAARHQVATLKMHLNRAVQQLEKQVESEKLTLRLMEQSQRAYQDLMQDVEGATHALASMVREEEVERNRFAATAKPLCTNETTPRIRRYTETARHAHQQEGAHGRTTRKACMQDRGIPCASLGSDDRHCPFAPHRQLKEMHEGEGACSDVESCTSSTPLLPNPCQRLEQYQKASRKRYPQVRGLKQGAPERVPARTNLCCSFCHHRAHSSTQWLVKICQLAFWRYSMQALQHPKRSHISFHNTITWERYEKDPLGSDVEGRTRGRTQSDAAASSPAMYCKPDTLVELHKVEGAEEWNAESSCQRHCNSQRNNDRCMQNTTHSKNGSLVKHKIRMPRENIENLSPRSPMQELPFHLHYPPKSHQAKPTLKALARVPESDWDAIEEWLVENEQRRMALETELSCSQKTQSRLESAREHQCEQTLYHKKRADEAEEQLLDLRRALDDSQVRLFEALANVRLQGHETQCLHSKCLKSERQLLQREQDVQHLRNKLAILEDCNCSQTTIVETLRIRLASNAEILEEYQQESELNMAAYSSCIQFAETLVQSHKMEIRNLRHLNNEIVDIGQLAADLVHSIEQGRERTSSLMKSDLGNRELIDKLQWKMKVAGEYKAEKDSQVADLQSVNERLELQLFELRSQMQEALRDNEQLRMVLKQTEHNVYAHHSSSTAMQSIAQEELQRARLQLVEAVAVIRSIVYLALHAHTSFAATGGGQIYTKEKHHHYSSVASRVQAVVEMGKKASMQVPALPSEQEVWDSSLLLDLVRSLEKALLDNHTITSC